MPTVNEILDRVEKRTAKPRSVDDILNAVESRTTPAPAPFSMNALRSPTSAVSPQQKSYQDSVMGKNDSAARFKQAMAASAKTDQSTPSYAPPANARVRFMQPSELTPQWADNALRTPIARTGDIGMVAGHNPARIGLPGPTPEEIAAQEASDRQVANAIATPARMLGNLAGKGMEYATLPITAPIGHFNPTLGRNISKGAHAVGEFLPYVVGGMINPAIPAALMASQVPEALSKNPQTGELGAVEMAKGMWQRPVSVYTDLSNGRMPQIADLVGIGGDLWMAHGLLKHGAIEPIKDKITAMHYNAAIKAFDSGNVEMGTNRLLAAIKRSPEYKSMNAGERTQYDWNVRRAIKQNPDAKFQNVIEGAQPTIAPRQQGPATSYADAAQDAYRGDVSNVEIGAKSARQVGAEAASQQPRQVAPADLATVRPPVNGAIRIVRPASTPLVESIAPPEAAPAPEVAQRPAVAPMAEAPKAPVKESLTTEAAAGKQPWEMNFDKWFAEEMPPKPGFSKTDIKNARPAMHSTHKSEVELAAQEGKIGAGIQDYPDLQAKYGKQGAGEAGKPEPVTTPIAESAVPKPPIPPDELARQVAEANLGDRATAIKNAITKAENEVYGLSPAEREAVKTIKDAHEKALAIVGAEPEAGRRLAQEINDKPRQASDVEGSILRLDRMRIENAYEKATDPAAKEALLKELADNTQATTHAGQHWSAAGQARKSMIYQDFSLASLVMRKRASLLASKGNVTPEELAQADAKVTAMHKELVDLQAKVTVYEEASTNKPGKATTSRFKIIRDSAEFKDILSGKDNKKVTIEMVQAARETLKQFAPGGEGAKKLGSGPSTEYVQALATEIAFHIERGARFSYRTLHKYLSEEYNAKDAQIKAAYRLAANKMRDERVATRLKSEDAALKDQLAKGEPMPTPPPIEHSKGTLALKEQVAKHREELVALNKEPKPATKDAQKALDMRKRFLRGQISKYQAAIKNREVIESKPSVSDAEVKTLQAALSKVRAEYKTINEKPSDPNVVTAKRDAARAKAYQTRIAKLEEAIKNKTKLAESAPAPLSKRTLVLKAQAAKLQAEYDAMNKQTPTKPSQSMRLEAAKKSLKKRLDTINSHLERRQAIEKIDPLEYDVAYLDMKKEVRSQMAKLNAEVGPPKPLGAKIRDVVAFSLNAPAGVLAAWDDSYLLRQGAAMLAHQPKVWTKGARDSLRAIKSEGTAWKIDSEIRHDPKFALAQRSKLAYTEMDPNAPLAATEETSMYMRPMERIKVLGKAVRPFDRAYTTAANVMRHEAFYRMADAMGKDWSPRQYADYASFLNKLTGRGDLGRLSSFQPELSGVFISSRKIASDFQLLMTPFTGGDRAVKAIAAKTLVRYTAALYTFGMVVNASGKAHVGLLPTDSDYMQLRVGNTRFDLTGGRAPLVRAIWATGEALWNQGPGGDAKFNDKQPIQEVLKYLGYKISPGLQSIAQGWTGKDFIGREVPRTSAVMNLITPWNLGDLMDAWKTDGAGMGVVAGIAGFWGVSAKSYSNQSEQSGGDAWTDSESSKY